MGDLNFTNTILDGIFMLLGVPNNIVGWIFVYVLGGMLFLLMAWCTVGVPIYLIMKGLIGK